MKWRIDPVMVYYVDEQAASLADLSDSWKGRKLPGKKRRKEGSGIAMICDMIPRLVSSRCP